jgi:uncharacterized protein
MKYEPLNLTHQQMLETRFRNIDVEISEYTFANVYLFRDIHRFEIVSNRDIYIRGRSRDNLSYLMPTTPIDQMDMHDLLESLEGCDFIFPIAEHWKPFFPEDKFQVGYLDEDSDYLYDIKTMSTFSGRKLSGRRNLLKQFCELFPNHRSDSLTSKNITDALKILEEWQNAAHEGDNFTDYTACKEGLELIEKLGLSGHITYVDDKPAAFLLGESLNSSTYVIHFAKALKEFKGIYQYLYNEYANFLAKKYQMLNLEQDMGAVEFRHAKRAYMPERLVPKLRVKRWNRVE